MSKDEISVHIDSVEQRPDILDHEVEECPECKGPLTTQFGMAGGGMGVYGFCPQCERIIWKCQTDE
jgi:uncharacterized protein with PIN domain